MGYYTSYELETEPKIKLDLELLETMTDYSWEEYSIGSYTPGDSIKWYDYDDHMKNLSKMFPEVTFSLDGSGEEQGDVWKTIYKNGETIKSYKSVMTLVDDENEKEEEPEEDVQALKDEIEYWKMKASEN
jgi:hypothetical protein